MTRKLVIIGSALSIMAAGAAHAQTTTQAASQSNTEVIAEAVNGGGGTGGSSGGWSGLHESGHIYGTPSVYAPSFANANPCTTPVSAGGAGGPIGLVLGFSPEDAACTRLHDVAAAWQMGMPLVALARWCQGRDNADAYFAATGKACPGQQDKARYRTVAATTPEQPQGAPVAALSRPAGPLTPEQVAAAWKARGQG